MEKLDSETGDLCYDKRVWHLVREKKADEATLPEPLEEPEEPEDPPTDTTEKVSRHWRDQIDRYKIKEKKWDDQQKALAAVNQWIMTNLDATHHPAMVNHATPRTRLAYLNKRFARSNAYKEDIRKQWNRVSVMPPKRGAKIDKWIDE